MQDYKGDSEQSPSNCPVVLFTNMGKIPLKCIVLYKTASNFFTGLSKGPIKFLFMGPKIPGGAPACTSPIVIVKIERELFSFFSETTNSEVFCTKFCVYRIYSYYAYKIKTISDT